MNYQWIHQQFSNVNMKDTRLYSGWVRAFVQLSSMREHCRLSPETRVEEVVPQCCIMLMEQRLRVKLKTVRDYWRCLARLGGFIGRKVDNLVIYDQV